MKTKSTFITKFLKNLFDFLFLTTLFLPIIITSCDKEEVSINSSNTVQSSSVEKSYQTNSHDFEKINNLKKGLRKRIIKYNISNNQENRFLKKYGKLDSKNAVTIKFPQNDENFLVAIPFKQDKLKNNKLLIAYYKNDVRTYKIVTKKNYELTNLYSSERAFLDNLNLLFELSYENSKITKLTSNCTAIILYHDYSTCNIAYQDPCTGYVWIISTLGKGEVCGGELDEVILDTPADDETDNENPNDPNDPTDYNPPSNEDPIDDGCLEFNCEENTGSGTNNDTNNDETDDTLEDNPPPSCKSFNFTQTASLWQEAAVKNIRFSVYLISPKGVKYLYTSSFPNPVLFGVPTNLSNGGNLGAGTAADISARALAQAMHKTVQKYHRTQTEGYQVDIAFKDFLKSEYPKYIPGGRVNFNPTSYSVIPTNYVTYGILRDDCSDSDDGIIDKE